MCKPWGDNQGALSLHGLHFSSCLQVPALSFLNGLRFKTHKLNRTSLLQIALVVVFITAIECRLRHLSSTSTNMD